MLKVTRPQGSRLANGYAMQGCSGRQMDIKSAFVAHHMDCWCKQTPAPLESQNVQIETSRGQSQMPVRSVEAQLTESRLCSVLSASLSVSGYPEKAAHGQLEAGCCWERT